MAQYLYKTVIYTDTTNVAGLNVSQNNSDLSDYETNNQSSTVKVSDVQIAETTFLSEETYTSFDSLITGDYDWGDVKEAEHDNRYELFLITSEAL